MKVVVKHHAPCMVATDHWVRIEELVAAAIVLFPDPYRGPQCVNINQSNMNGYFEMQIKPVGMTNWSSHLPLNMMVPTSIPDSVNGC